MTLFKKHCLFLAIFAFNFIFATSEFNLDKVYDIENIVPFLVIGSGPCGLTAGIYGANGGIPTLVLTGDMRGGQLNLTPFIENWPGVRNVITSDLIDTLFKQAKDFGSYVLEDSIASVNLEKWPFEAWTDSGVKLNVLSMLIATGSTPKRLEVPGEDGHFGRGVSTCANCDGHFFGGKEVVVVGGGNSALEEAIQLSSHAKKVTVFVRGSSLRAADRLQKKIVDYDKIKILFNREIVEILGPNNKVTGVKVKNNLTGEVSVMKTDGVFLAIGRTPNTSLFNGKLKLNSSGYICTGENFRTVSSPAIFAAGEVADTGCFQAVEAASAGSIAARAAVQFLREIGFTDKFVKSAKRKFFVNNKKEVEA